MFIGHEFSEPTPVLVEFSAEGEKATEPSHSLQKEIFNYGWIG